MTGSAADILVKYLEQEGVEYLFGVPGGHLLPLYDAVQRSGKIRAVLNKHESGAAFMAYGYAVTTGKVGVCCGTVGPGAMNLVTGVASAYMDSVPILVLTAQVGTTAFGKGALQEGTGVGRTIHHVGMFEKITKLSTLEINAENIPFAVKRAFRVAQTGRKGPVHLDLPANVQAAKVSADIDPVVSYRSEHKPLDRSNLESIAEVMLNARKPAILVGYGGRSRNGAQSLENLAEILRYPVATTLRAKGAFPEDHDLALGCVGLYGTRAANSYLRSGVDVLLTLGSSFHEFTTHCWDEAFIPSTALIQVDIDPEEIGKNYPVSMPVQGDCGAFVEALISCIGDRKRDGSSISEIKAKTEYFAEPAMDSDSIPVKPQRLMRDLTNAMPRSSTVFADIGNTLTFAERNLKSYPEGFFGCLTGLAAMGSATAAIVGAKLGRPSEPAVCLCGDGDFHMTGFEVATAVNHNIPVIWIILKNNRLGMIYDTQAMTYQNRYIASDFSDTDFAALADALGAEGRRIESPGDIGPVLDESLAAQKPTVIEVSIDPEELPPVKPRSMALKRSMGIPDPIASISWDALKALWTMVKER